MNIKFLLFTINEDGGFQYAKTPVENGDTKRIVDAVLKVREKQIGSYPLDECALAFPIFNYLTNSEEEAEEVAKLIQNRDAWEFTASNQWDYPYDEGELVSFFFVHTWC